MNNIVPIPITQEEANAPTTKRVMVIMGGLLSAFFLLPTVPYLWVIVGAILVPVVWVRTGNTRKSMMMAAGCATKEQWKSFVANLPTKKQLQQAQASTVYRAPVAQTAVGRDQRSRTSTGSPNSFISPPRPELNYPHYPLIRPNRANVEVVGEAYREKSVIAALGGLVPENEKTVEDAPAFLIHEPENPYGKGHAVMVWINGHHVGYLASEDAALYMPYIKKITDAGFLPTTTGRIWGVSRHDWEGKLRYHLYARVALNDPDQLFPTNNPPASPYSFLPWGNAIQVTKESDHLAELTEHLHGPDSYAVATIRQATRTLKNGTVREYATVHIDGDEIGELTPNMSEKILPSVRHLNDLEYEAAAWARVKGSALAIEVTLQVAKAHEIPDSWLVEIPVTIPHLQVAEQQNPLERGQDSEDEQRTREGNWDF